MPTNSIYPNSTGISPHRQSNGLFLSSASTLSLNPNHHHPSRTTSTGTQPVDEEELALTQKLEEMERQEKLVNSVMCQIFSVKLRVSTSLHFPISPVLRRSGCALLIGTMISNMPPTSILSPGEDTSRVLDLLFTVASEPDADT